jgi:hypothetical protein
VLVSGLILTACSNDGLTLARQACTYVNRSIRLYNRTLHQTDVTQINAELQQVVVWLEDAIPLAAQANSADPQWNPLMTTLQEVRRNELSNLMPALEAQCHQAGLPNEQPPPFNNVPTGGNGGTSTPPAGGGTSQPSGSAPTTTPSPPSTLVNPKLP